MLESILEFLKAAWNFVRKYFVKLFDFFSQIRQFFENPRRKGRLEDLNIIATMIRENLDNGNVRVVDCLYDKARKTVVDVQDMQVVTAEELDEKTKEAFGRNNLLILEY